MRERERSLLRRIEQDLLEENTSTTSILRKAIILGGHAGSTALRDWARKELNGYSNDDSVPEYRKLTAAICIDGQNGPHLFRGQTIGVEDLPEVAREQGVDYELELRQSLGELEALASGDRGSIDFHRLAGSIIMKMMNREINEPFAAIHRVYWRVQREALEGVVEQVRTALAELVAELLHALPHDADMPTKQATDQAVNYLVTGKRAVLTVNHSVASDGSTSTISTSPSPGSEESWWQRWRKRGLIIGVATVISAVAGVGAWLGWKPGDDAVPPPPPPVSTTSSGSGADGG